MRISQDSVAEKYQCACDALMAIAQDYQVSQAVADKALKAANYITVSYIDNALDEINQLTAQYKKFTGYLESVVVDLNRNLVDEALIIPLRNLLKS